MGNLSEWIDEFIQWVGVDKVLHFCVAGWLTSILLICGMSVVHMVVFSSILYVVKEIMDVYKVDSSGFSVLDLVADYTGMCVSLLIWYVFKVI